VNASPAERRISEFGSAANDSSDRISVGSNPATEIVFFWPYFYAWPGILTGNSLVKAFSYMSKEFFSDCHCKIPPFFSYFPSANYDAPSYKKDSKQI